MKMDTSRSYGCIINLLEGFENQYIAIRQHALPYLSGYMARYHFSDCSLFMDRGILFSHLRYTGFGFEEDMQALFAHMNTQQWWKHISGMLQLPGFSKENRWCTSTGLWFGYDFNMEAGPEFARYAYILPVPAALPETMPDAWLGDFGFWGSTYGLKTFRIFKSRDHLYIYIEKDMLADHSFLLEILTRVFDVHGQPVALKEIFHFE